MRVLKLGSLEHCKHLNNCTLLHKVLLLITKHVYEDFNLYFLVSIRSIVMVGLLIFDTQQRVIIIIFFVFSNLPTFLYILLYFWFEHVNITVNFVCILSL